VPALFVLELIDAVQQLRRQDVYNVIPAKAGIQNIQLIAFWIAQKLHCVSAPDL